MSVLVRVPPADAFDVFTRESALPDDHPVRHGVVGAAFAQRMGLYVLSRGG